MAKEQDSSGLFVNIDKKGRAEQIYTLVSGAKQPKSEGDAYNKERFLELMKENDVDGKDKAATILFIYQKLGGAVVSHTEVAAKKAAAKKPTRSMARTAKADDDDEGTDADAADDDADDDE